MFESDVRPEYRADAGRSNPLVRPGSTTRSIRLGGWAPTPIFDHLHDACGGNEIYALSPREAIARVSSVAPRLMNDAYALAAAAARATTPPEAAAALADFGRPAGPDVAVIDLGSNFVTIDPDRHMPVAGRRNPRKPLGANEVALLGLVQAAGFAPFSLIPEAGLDLVMAVSPAPGREETPTGAGQAAPCWHVDNMPLARPYRPDVLALMGLVATERVATSFVHIDDVLRKLRQPGSRHEEVLRQPRFAYYTPGSFHGDGSRPVLSDPMPVIADDADGRAEFHFNEYRLVADRTDPEVASALNALAAALRDESVIRREYVSPGKTLLLSNTRVLHSRGDVRGKRYLMRLYGKRDLSALRALPSGGDRVFPYRFMMTPAEVVAACRGSARTRRAER